jgi:predicted transcriptional regulator
MMNEDKFNKKSTPVSIRIPNDILKELDSMAETENIDRISWIRRAIMMAIEDLNQAEVDGAIEDYVCLRIDEAELKDISGMKKIPDDLKKAREGKITFLMQKSISEGRKDGKNS